MTESGSERAREAEGYPSLERDLETEALVIGGGNTGVMAAYQLAKSGVPCVLVESGRIGSGATAKTTAFLTQVTDIGLSDLEADFGAETAKGVWNAGRSAVDAIAAAVSREGIDCGFIRCPLHLFASDAKQRKAVEQERAAAARLGVSVEFTGEDALPFPTYGSLTFPDQAKIDADPYVRALAKAASDAGALIFENTEAKRVLANDSIQVETSRARVRAKRVFVATHLPFNRPRALFLRKAVYTSYVLEAKIPAGAMPEALYVDVHNPYRYFRVDRREGGDRLIFGGEDHRSDFPANAKKNFAALEETVRKVLPDIRCDAVRRWSGPIVESVDRIPWIGEYAANQFAATGFSGNGLTYGTLSALIFRDLALGKENPFAKHFDFPRGQSLGQFARNGVHFTRELFGGAVKNAFR
jgi:glycine/D-amino acid oxidase-like deaminating enzyme